MSEDVYTTNTTTKGIVQYRKNGKLISKEAYDTALAYQATLPPENVLPLEPTEEAGTVAPTVQELDNYDTKPKRVCLFCGEPATKARMLNMNTYNLCAGHYEEKTLGEIAQHERNQTTLI